MSNHYILYNPHAKNETAGKEVTKIEKYLPNEQLTYIDISKNSSYPELFEKMSQDDMIVLVGGDGTINRFVNDTENIKIKNDIYYFGIGTGTDFLTDISKKGEVAPFSLKEYIKDLPTVEIKGKSYRFLNGVGYGIDGYCCEVADQIRGKTDKPINYSAIAIKGLLFHYKPTNATVLVDGTPYMFEKVWLAPTMNGRFYGGGMMITPSQNRLSTEKKLSLGVLHGSGKLRTLMIFPSIFKGKHVKYKKYFKILEGKEITVEFDRPTALQIDGETILNVKRYTARAGVRSEELVR
ncbi:MAG: diacylglycerol kinase family protein [Clostridia bacterium]|nr:diacylglycerol kinase family protein [Clostridia bacterium]